MPGPVALSRTTPVWWVYSPHLKDSSLGMYDCKLCALFTSAERTFFPGCLILISCFLYGLGGAFLMIYHLLHSHSLFLRCRIGSSDLWYRYSKASMTSF